MKLKRMLSLLLSAVMVLALAACGSKTATETTDAPSEETDNPKVLTMAVSAELNTLYPLNMDVQNNVATKLCYEGLVNYVDGQVEPCLAESWEFSNEGKDLTFKLRQGVTYHDGTPFNAEAVKTCFEFAKDNPNFGAIRAACNLESVEVVDDYTVTFHYPNAYFAYLYDFCYPEVMILESPKVILPEEDENRYMTMSGVVGTGPYIYDEIVAGDYVRFVRNDNYWGETPDYDEVIVKYIPESSARLQALQNGDIDMIYGSALMTWDDYEQATSLPNIKGVVSSYDSNTRNVVLNAGSAKLGDLKVREAIAYAIDKGALSAGLTLGNESAANKLFPEGTPYTSGSLNVVRTYDQEKANALLDEAGWKMNDSTGIREKDGEPLSVVFTYDFGNVMNQSIATIIRSQLAEVGIEVTTTGQDMMTWWKEGASGNYDMTIWNTEQPYTAPHNFFAPMLNRSAHAPSLAALPDISQFEACVAEFQTSDDEARIQEIFDYLLNFDNDNVIDLPLLYVKDMIVFNTDKISDYTFTSTPMFFDIRQLTPAK